MATNKERPRALDIQEQATKADAIIAMINRKSKKLEKEKQKEQSLKKEQSLVDSQETLVKSNSESSIDSQETLVKSNSESNIDSQETTPGSMIVNTPAAFESIWDNRRIIRSNTLDSVFEELEQRQALSRGGGLF